MNKAKRKDECLFCNSRSCYERLFSFVDGGKTYDEIACRQHVEDLYKHAYGRKTSGVRICSMSSTGKHKRGEAIDLPDSLHTEQQALNGVPPKDAVLYVVCTESQGWHIAFDYEFMGRWVLISTTGVYLERNEIKFSRRCDSLIYF
jgi:hypothetical protein